MMMQPTSSNSRHCRYRDVEIALIIDRIMDVLVVGAGLTGAMIAAQMAESGLRVGVVDAQRVGQGATARAIGLATLDPSAAHFDQTAHGMDLLRGIADRNRVRLQSCSTLHLSSTAEGTSGLQRAAADHPASRLEWIAQPEMLPRGFAGGLLVHDGALVDMDRLVTRLLQHPRIVVKQNVEITRLESREGKMYALGREHTLAAKCVVLSANAYIGMLSPYLAESVRVARSAVFVSHPLRDGTATKYALPAVIDGGQMMIAPAGEGRIKAAAWQPEGNPADPYDILRAFLKRTDAHLAEQAEHWTASVTTLTNDGAPFVGKLDTDGNVYYALGLGAFGLAWAPVVAEQVAGMVLNLVPYLA